MLNRAFVLLGSFGFGNRRSVPSLDGLRAVSIGFVLLAHLTGTRNFPSVLAPGLGEFGVRIFFVISGFLITTILLKELSKTGHISLPLFYFRRALRLFPASYSLIAVVAVLAAMHLTSLDRWDLAFAISYTMNYHDPRGWPLGHLWSLAIEEQFYLLWPVMLRFLGPKRATCLLLVVLTAAPFLRLTSVYVGPWFNFLIWSDSLATGCLLALMRERLSANPTYSRILTSRWFVFIPIIALSADYVPFTKIQWLIGETTMNLAIALSIDWAIRNADGAVGKFLNLPSVSFVGVLSYSLYLWQQIFLNRYSSSPLCTFPINLVLTFAVALGSYLFIEVPSLRFRAAAEHDRTSLVGRYV
jgi:peptidoglycan/LPS O-acetylase OafA/YrhL